MQSMCATGTCPHQETEDHQVETLVRQAGVIDLGALVRKARASGHIAPIAQYAHAASA